MLNIATQEAERLALDFRISLFHCYATEQPTTFKLADATLRPAPSRRQWIPVEAGEVYVRRWALPAARLPLQAQIGAKTGEEDAAASDLSSSAAAPVHSTAFTMGVTPAASLSHGDSNNAAGSDDDAHMGLDERDLADSKKIMLKLLVQVGSDAKVDRDVVASQQLRK